MQPHALFKLFHASTQSTRILPLRAPDYGHFEPESSKPRRSYEPSHSFSLSSCINSDTIGVLLGAESQGRAWGNAGVTGIRKVCRGPP